MTESILRRLIDKGAVEIAEKPAPEPNPVAARDGLLCDAIVSVREAVTEQTATTRALVGAMIAAQGERAPSPVHAASAPCGYEMQVKRRADGLIESVIARPVAGGQ